MFIFIVASLVHESLAESPQLPADNLMDVFGVFDYINPFACPINAFEISVLGEFDCRLLYTPVVIVYDIDDVFYYCRKLLALLYILVFIRLGNVACGNRVRLGQCFHSGDVPRNDDSNDARKVSRQSTWFNRMPATIPRLLSDNGRFRSGLAVGSGNDSYCGDHLVSTSEKRSKW